MYDKNADCPSDAFYGNPVNPVAGSMSFHTLATIISAACTVFAILLGVFLAFLHLCRYTRPQEQRQIVRIVITPAFISTFCFFGVWFESTTGFLKPIGEYYECVALPAVFLLFITFATPMQERGRNIFDSLETLQQRNGGGNMSTYYRLWLLTFQIIPVRLITLVTTFAVAGSECKLLKHNTKGHTIISVITAVSTVMCFISILRMTKFLKPVLKDHGPVFKLVALKLVVGLDVLQTMLFSILQSTNAIKPTSTLSLPDLMIGIPGLMVCIECAIFAFIFLWPYSPTPYKVAAFEVDQGRDVPKSSFIGALIDVFDIRDILMGVLSIFSAFQGMGNSNGSRGIDQSQGYAVNQEYDSYEAASYRK